MQLITCTLKIRSSPIQRDNIQYESIDTVGFDPSPGGPVSDEQSLSELLHFIKEDKQGFHCVLFVTRKGRLNAMFHENHFIFVECFIKQHIPTILVVTGCEMDKPLNQWGR